MSDSPDLPVVWGVQDGIAVVRFNLPAQRNPMTPAVQSGLADALSHLASVSEVRAMVLTGEGTAFSAGGDMDLMRALPTLATDDAEAALAGIYPPFLSLLDFPAPTIAAVNGAAVGGGLGIALLCDIRVAAATATFSAPFGMVGLPPGMGLTFLLPHLLGTANALELLLTSSSWDAETAERRGLVSSVVKSDDLLDEALRVARKVTAASPQVIDEVIQHVRRPLRSQVHEALSREVVAQARAVRHPDYMEGLDAILEKRKPSFGGNSGA